MFVTPYPPGFPLLVPGQVVTSDILGLMSVLDSGIHGYLPEFGLPSVTEEVLQAPARLADAAVQHQRRLDR